MTGTLPSTASTTAAITSLRSPQGMLWNSPELPSTTIPSTPPRRVYSTRRPMPSRSAFSPGVSGVTSAGMLPFKRSTTSDMTISSASAFGQQLDQAIHDGLRHLACLLVIEDVDGVRDLSVLEPW